MKSGNADSSTRYSDKDQSANYFSTETRYFLSV